MAGRESARPRRVSAGVFPALSLSHATTHTACLTLLRDHNTTNIPLISAPVRGPLPPVSVGPALSPPRRGSCSTGRAPPPRGRFRPGAWTAGGGGPCSGRGPSPSRASARTGNEGISPTSFGRGRTRKYSWARASRAVSRERGQKVRRPSSRSRPSLPREGNSRGSRLYGWFGRLSALNPESPLTPGQMRSEGLPRSSTISRSCSALVGLGV